VLGLAVVAALDALSGGGATAPAEKPVADARGEPLGGPLVPPPGLLEGSLALVAGEGCELATLDLATAVLRESGTASCDLWAAPHGELALVSAARRGSRYELWLAHLGENPVLLKRLGLARGEPSWSNDGARAAWCTPAGETRVVDLHAGTEHAVRGCSPRLAPDGSVLTRPDRAVSSAVLRDGRVLLDEHDLARGFAVPPEWVDVLGVDENSSGLLAVAVASIGRDRFEVVLELWQGDSLVDSRPLRAHFVPGVGAFGGLLRFSPAGDELAIGFPRPAVGLMVLDLRSGRVVRDLSPARGFAWSPDGLWLAVATRDVILIAGAIREDTVFALPLAATALAWT
jgi:hypothetical protein